jgi:peptidoglycan/LPS O-acetylase OafA/YrhL
MTTPIDRNRYSQEAFNTQKIPSLKSNMFQIDFLKTIAIFFVIMDHTFTHTFLAQYGAIFWERTAIPIFMVLMGFTLGLSFHRKFKDQEIIELKDLYTRDYFESRIKRYIIPYLVIYIIQLITWGIIQIFKISIIKNNPFYESDSHILLGYSPFWGPGMWFMPVLFTGILILPLIYYFYRQNPGITVVSCIGLEFFFRFIASTIYTTNNYSFFVTHILYMVSAIGLGLWMVDGYGLNEWRNKFYYYLLMLGIGFIVIYSFRDSIVENESPLIILLWLFQGDYHIFFFSYSAFLVLLALNYIPENPQGVFANFIRKIGKSTYHILMTQILYFSYIYHFMFDIETGFESTPMNYLWFFPVNLLITFTIGILWNTLERKFYKNFEKKPIRKWIYRIFFWLSVIFLGIRFFTQYIFLFL